ncbi:MAG: menaquinone biosynthesis decarboxylase [Phycisphaeraceae bacterium]|nr:menaquinone biosynthesis decarboxylase [Phycisphaeraceae bacterium]
MYRSLGAFIEALEQAGELHRVKAKVSPMLEIAEIADRVSKSPAQPGSGAASFDPHHAHLGGKALLFEHVEGSDIPVLINAFGSYRRMEMALGCTDGGFAVLAERVARLAKPEPPHGLVEKLKKIPELAKIASLPPRVVRQGACQEVVTTGDEVDLHRLPIIKCWPHDGDPSAFGLPDVDEGISTRAGEGRYITFGGIHTIAPEDAGKADGVPRSSRNVGMYRAQLLDRNHTVMHWHMHHDGARHWRRWKDKGEPMPVALALGGDSVLPYCATAPLPPGISELMFAGFLNDGPIDMVRCRTVDLHVPANCEIVLEGHVSVGAGPPGWEPRSGTPLGDEAAFEGPFGDHTGFYSLPDRYPVFTVTAVTHRRSPIYPTTIVGLPPQEDYYMGKATERIFLPLLQTIVPDILDYDLPMFGAFHNCVFVRIRKEYPLQARRVMHAIWGAGQMAWTKFVIVVDEHVDVHDHEQVLFHLCANVDPGRDLELVHGPLDILDHAAPQLGAGHKMGIDATAKIDGEQVGGHAVRDWPKLIEMDEQTRSLVDLRWAEYGL